MDGLRRHKELIESQANLLHLQQYQHDSHVNLLHIQQYQRDSLNIRDQLSRLEEAEQQRKYTAVMEWVSGAKTKLDHDSCCDARSEYPGSGSWILQNPEFENWKEASTPVSSILWLKGIPGAGMVTMLLNSVESTLYAC